jgi:hypothetical protein
VCVCCLFACTPSEAVLFLREADPSASVSKYMAEFDALHLLVNKLTSDAALDPASANAVVCMVRVSAIFLAYSRCRAYIDIV